MKQPGFMIYVDDWELYAGDYSDEEIGQMLRALLTYFTKRERTEFSDRGMRQFFRQTAKAIDLDAKRYADKCFQNAYNRYRGTCKQRDEKPLSFEEWLTTVDERHQPSPIPIPTTNNQKSIPNTNNQQSDPIPRMNTRNERDCQGETRHDPLSPEEFEKLREAKIEALKRKSIFSSS